jgi:hypothetical protein
MLATGEEGVWTWIVHRYRASGEATRAVSVRQRPTERRAISGGTSTTTQLVKLWGRGGLPPNSLLTLGDAQGPLAVAVVVAVFRQDRTY